MASWDDLTPMEQSQARTICERIEEAPQTPRDLALSFAVSLRYLRRILSALGSIGAAPYSYPRGTRPDFKDRTFSGLTYRLPPR